MEAEARNYNPYGRGGGGAPLKDSSGAVVSALFITYASLSFETLHTLVTLEVHFESLHNTSVFSISSEFETTS